METLLLIIHIIVCFFLVIIVLLQSGKSADLAGAFGSMGSQSSFGPRGSATLLSKLTTTLAIMFMLTSLSLYILGAQKGKASSIMDNTKQTVQTTDTKKPAAVPTIPAGKTAETPKTNGTTSQPTK